MSITKNQADNHAQYALMIYWFVAILLLKVGLIYKYATWVSAISTCIAL